MPHAISKTELREIVSHVVSDVFGSMMSMEIECLDSSLEVPHDGNRVVGSVGFGGEEAGVICLHVREDFSRIMTAAMLGMDNPKDLSEEDVNDAIGELTNMTAGNIKSQLYDIGSSSSALAVPSIVRGTSMEVETIRVARREHFVFRHKDQYILLELYLKPG